MSLRSHLRNELGAVVHEYRSRGYGTEVAPIEDALTDAAIGAIALAVDQERNEQP